MALFIRNCSLKNRLGFNHYMGKSLFHRDCKSFKEIEPFDEKTKSPDPHKPVIKKQILQSPEHMHKNTAYDKWVISFVMRKQFPTKEDVPDEVSDHAYSKARSLYRIRINIFLMILASIGFFAFAKKFKHERDKEIDMDYKAWEKRIQEGQEKAKAGAEQKAVLVKTS